MNNNQSENKEPDFFTPNAPITVSYTHLDVYKRQALGCFTGLRISDILALRWNQILDAEEFTIIEIKTGKQRTIRINMQLQQHIRDCYEHINPVGINAPVLISQKGTVYTVQRINVMLKEIKKKYRLQTVSYTHLL